MPKNKVEPLSDSEKLRNWGEPEEEEDLIQALVSAAGQVKMINIAFAKDEEHNTQWRPEFVIKVSKLDFRRFFNSPNGYRGHFYASPKQGRDYSLHVLEKVAAAIKFEHVMWGKSPFQDDDTQFRKKKEFLKKCIGRADVKAKVTTQIRLGKLWTLENNSPIRVSPWPKGHEHPRWRTKIDEYYDDDDGKKQFAGLMQDLNDWLKRPLPLLRRPVLFNDSDVDNPNEEYHTQTKVDELVQSMKSNMQVPSKGSQRFISSSGSIDVKGAWSELWVPENKKLRSLQLKWFGWT